MPRYRRIFVPMSGLLFLLLGCDSGPVGPKTGGPEMPSGTKVSGTITGGVAITKVGFRKPDSGDIIFCEFPLEGGEFEWALPAGKYEVVALADGGGGLAVVKEITVESSPVVVDIPADLKFEPWPAEKKPAEKKPAEKKPAEKKPAPK